MRALWFAYSAIVAVIVALSALMFFTADNVESQGMFLAVCLGLGVPAILLLTVICLLASWVIRKWGNRDEKASS